MPQAAVPLMAGATVVGAHQQSKAAKRASRAQERAADEAAQVQREAMQSFRMASEPFRFGAQQSINPLLSLLGIAPVALPTTPVFDMMTGLPRPDPTDRIAEINARLEELRAIRPPDDRNNPMVFKDPNRMPGNISNRLPKDKFGG